MKTSKYISRIARTNIVKKGQLLGSVEVLGGNREQVNVLAAEGFSYALSPDEKPEIILSGPGFAYAPVVDGEEAGFAYVCIGESAIGKIPVVYEMTVEQSVPEKKNVWERWFGGRK